MPHRVLLAEGAERDIEDIYRYIAQRESVERADHVLQALEGACGGLANLPDRGNVPKELAGLGITDYREVHYKPFRIIHRIMGPDVVIYCVADGRRDMQSFLERRLLHRP